MDALIFVIVFIAIALGYFLGRCNPSLPSRQAHLPIVHQRYVEGLKYLLDEQPDAAIDALVADLEITQETLEMYFSLGALWRRRGEMERAIRVHQTLLENSALTPLQRQQAQLELALDYTHSGVLDRGEVLLKELSDQAFPAIQQAAGKELVLLFQEEREWEKAVAAVDELCRKADIMDTAFWRHLQAHYCCELAERIMGAPDWDRPDALAGGISAVDDAARAWLTQAERHAPGHPRVLLIMTLLAIGRRDLTAARSTLCEIKLQPDYSMVLVPLMLSVDSHDTANLWEDLESFYRDSRDTAVLPFVADLIYQQHGEARALDFLIQELREHDDMAPAVHLLGMVKESSFQYARLRSVLPEILPFQFNCHQCGFQGRHFYWCCPSCKTWR